MPNAEQRTSLSDRAQRLRERLHPLRRHLPWVPAGLLNEAVQSNPPDLLLINKATMVCLRGPCTRYHNSRTSSSRQNFSKPWHTTEHWFFCDRLGAFSATAGDLPIACTSWWPAPLSWVPESFRPMIRRTVEVLWEIWLTKVGGYSFEWRRALKPLEDDNPEDRARPYLGRNDESA